MAKLTEDKRSLRRIENKIKRATFDYDLINDGDRILVGLSGGKDSLALVDSPGRRSKTYCPRSEVVVVHIVMMNIPCCSDWEYLRSRAEEHDLSFIVHKTSFDPSTDTRKPPCFSCPWTRRRALFEIAKAHKRGRIALGHHQDDIPETLLMNLTHQRVFGTMPLRLKMDKSDMEIICLMYLMEERGLIQVAAWKGYRKQLKNCPYGSGSSRSDMKELLRSLGAINPEARYSLWGGMTNI